MAIPYWPPTLPQKPWTEGYVGGPQDNRAAFDPETGPQLLRRRTTADGQLEEVTFRQLKDAQLATFAAFVATTLAGGSLGYCWREPVTDAPYMWQIVKTGETIYRRTSRKAGFHDVTFKLMRRPAVPWWATYLRAGSSRPPYIVADWTNSVFGVDGEKVTASVMPTLSGTFDVSSWSTAEVETYTTGQVIAVGGIPATAPGSTKRRIYFLP